MQLLLTLMIIHIRVVINFVEVLTGAMELMRILLGAHSMAILFIKFSTPALAAPLWLWGEGGSS